MSAQAKYPKPINPVTLRARVANLGALQRIVEHGEQALGLCAALDAQGFTVRSVTLGGIEPIVDIEPHPALADMVEQNNATYYHTRYPLYRVGTFQAHGCKVIWTEVLQ